MNTSIAKSCTDITMASSQYDRRGTSKIPLGFTERRSHFIRGIKQNFLEDAEFQMGLGR